MHSNKYVYLMLSLILLLIAQVEGSAQCTEGTISGSVFNDQNFDGSFNSADTGVSNVLVRAYDGTGSVAGSATSDSEGTYTISNLNDGSQYRLEVTYGQNYQSTYLGTDNESNIRFEKPPYCKANFGVKNAGYQCSQNPEILVTCFVQGTLGQYDSYATIVGLEHDFSASSGVSVYATKAETGSIWGLAYRSSTNEVFSSAFVKQYAALTQSGHDAIYKTDLNTNTTSLFVKLSTLGINTGTLPVTNEQDCGYGAQVGKYGIGNIVLSNDQSKLYAVNIFDNSIVEIDVDNPTAGTTITHSIPTPNCVGGNARAFALELHNGQLYVGVTCDANVLQDAQYSEFYVYEFDASTGNFSEIFNTDYTEGFWIDTPSDAIATSHWLTDLEFTDEGNMLLAVSDRFGHRYCNGYNGRVDQQKPDLLVVWNDNGTWTLESNGIAGPIVGSGVGNGDGPGGGEFFGYDFFPADPSYHSEVALGSVLAIPGTGEVVASVFDPFFNTYSGGLHRYNTSNGLFVDFKELYTHNLVEYFGKATGFGEIIAICPKVSPEIGNYVWYDADSNGIQDGTEDPINNLDLVLLDKDCNIVGTTSTNVKGQYAFNDGNVQGGLIPGNQYCIAIDPAQVDQNSGSFLIGGINYNVTIPNEDDQLGSDLVVNPSKCPSSGISHFISAGVQTNHDIDHSYDIGLIRPNNFDLAIMKSLVTPYPIGIGDIVEFEVEVFNQGDIAASVIEIIDYSTPNFEFLASSNPGWTQNGNDYTYTFTGNLAPGETLTISLFLQLLPSTNSGDYINYAEVSSTVDQFGDPDSDTDSTADDVNGNDNGGNCGTSTDDEINDNGTFDEDDHDVACVDILDLALLKELRLNQNYQIGDQVTFDITIYNQGNVDVSNIGIVDYVPEEMSFDPTLNTGWVSAGNGMYVYEFGGTLLVGQTVTISITLTLESLSEDGPITNKAEIFDFEGPQGVLDIDSTPDMDCENDEVIDNEINFDGKDDEDDHDISVLNVEIVDLALMKTIDQVLVERGTEVTFDIEIYNQGDAIVYSVEIVDYLPEFFTLVGDNWEYDADTHQAYQTIFFPEGLAMDEIYLTTITLYLAEDAEFIEYINIAEINAVFDANGNEIGQMDIDSTPDDDRSNEVWGLQYDDSVHAFDDNDEDDHDGATLYAADTEVIEECSCIGDQRFRDVIVITAPSNQEWYIDTVFGFFDSTSPLPPAPLVPFTTGPGTLYFTEVILGMGYSEYTISGIHLDGDGYSIRFANELGFFLQYQTEGCNYDDAVIQGVNYEDNIYTTCTNTTATYQVDLADDCVIVWSLQAGGDITSPLNQETVVVEWGNQIGDYELIAEVFCPGFCPKPTILTVNVGSSTGSIGCINDLNLSLDSDCCVEITPSMVLAGTPTPNAGYGVMVLDAHGHPVPNNKVTDEHIGQELTVKLIDACSGNSCWAFMYIEDKTPPTIQCDDITLDCTTIHTYEPLVIDNCGEVMEVRMIEEVVIPNNDCDPDTDLFIKEIIRSYVAVDSYGNESQPCHQRIFVKRFDFDGIDDIPNYTVEDGTYLSCADAVYNAEGTPDTSWTGVPTWNTFQIYPFPDFYCNVGIDHTDYILADEGCVKKYMRTWIFYEACGDIGAIDTITQVIEIMDTEDPVIKCDENIVITTSGETCDRTVFLPPPLSIEDDCTESGGFLVNIRYPGGFLDDAEEGGFVELPAGNHEITYLVYDECLNADSCKINILVKDDTPPVAICDEFTVVSLRGDGTAEAWSKSLDDGSYDDCFLHSMLVRKMTPDEDACECDIPYFVDMNLLGEFNNSYYYISKHKINANLAYSYAQSMGGHPAVILNEDEDTWVKMKADSVTGGARYYIGLNDVASEGNLIWEDGVALGYSNFGTGDPATSLGDYTVVNVGGEWVIVSGSEEYYYVFETDDPCGWSEYVNFCCSEVGTEQMVVFRAVDYFGNFNDCMVTVEVQDKVAPELTCPDDFTINCDTPYNLDDLSEFGTPTATDSCLVEITQLEPVITVDQCGVGIIKRRWRASDQNGSEGCVQEIHIINPDQFDDEDIDWPDDFTVDNGCSTDTFDPDNLDDRFAYPRFDEDFCDLIGVSYDDEIYFFIGDDFNACYKIIRTWEVIDWCKVEDEDYIWTYQQSIKIDDTEAPVITSGCEETDPLCTFECDGGAIILIAEATDVCTPDEMLNWSFEFDEGNDGEVDLSSSGVGAQIDASGVYPVGHHSIIYSFEDGCGNVTSCLYEFSIINCKPPTAACIEGLSIGLEPMDLDGDGVPDTEMACLDASFFDASSFHPCGYDLKFVFCDDPENPDMADTTHCFDCNTCGLVTVNICVIDEFDNVDFCVTTLEVQDNNDFDFCEEPQDCILPPTDITIDDCPSDLVLADIGGQPSIVPNCSCDDFTMTFVDEFPSYPNANCNFIIRTWSVSANCGCPAQPETFIQNIFADNMTPPVITCPADIGPIDANTSNCTAFVNVPLPTIENSCQSGVTITHNYAGANSPNASNASGEYPIGTTQVVFTATNECGLATNCSINVIVQDNSGPLCNALDVDVKLNFVNTASVSIETITMNLSDDCGDVTAAFVDGSSRILLNCSNLGENTVPIIVTDENMNTSSCNATITVIENAAPVCTLQDFIVTLDAMGTATVTLDDLNYSAIDNCDTNIEITSPTVFTFNCTDIGDNAVSVTIVDNSGNTNTCSAIVTVTDNISPICTIDDITVSVMGGSITVTQEALNVMSSDDCGNVMVQDMQDIIVDCDDVGTVITATVTVIDNSDNSSTCSGTITVIDDNMPTCNFADDIELCIGADGMVEITPEIINTGGGTGSCGVGLNYNIDPTFFACNDTGTQTVSVTVSDSAGNSCSDTFTVEVEDKMLPTFGNCPADVTITCADDISNLDVFGNVNSLNVFDNCSGSITIESMTPIRDLNICNVGTITRTWIITDSSNNSATCTQVITINNTNPFTENNITWPPANETVNCNDAGFGTEPIINVANKDCTMIEVSFEDDSLPNDCELIIRTWTVEDMCQERGSNSFTFVQNIRVADNENPTVIIDDIMTVTIEDDVCLGTVIFGMSISDDCTTPDALIITNDFQGDDLIFTNNNDGTFSITGRYCTGVSTFNITVTDACGKSTTEEVSVTVAGGDCFELNCMKVNAILNANGSATINANDLLDMDNVVLCAYQDVQASFSDMGIVSDMVISCSDLNPLDGGNIALEVYFFVDGVFMGQPSCSEFNRPVVVFTNFSTICPGNLDSGVISGRIESPMEEPIYEVMVELEGSNIGGIMTDDEGGYAFPPMPYGGNYSIVPVKDNDPLNGVSTLDLILMQQHILGTEEFVSPYQYIAADVNKSRSVTSLDIIELRKLILGTYDSFQENSSWRMIDAAFQFEEGENPFNQAIPDEYNIFNLETNMDINFVGVKVGDVNYSAVANLNSIDIEDRSDEILKILYHQTKFEQGEEFNFEINVEGFKGLQGAQFDLKLDPQMLDIQRIEFTNPEIFNESNVNLNLLENGIIPSSWHLVDAMQKVSDISLMKIHVKAKMTGTLSEAIFLNTQSSSNQVVKNEGYMDNQPTDLTLISDTQNEDDLLVLYQNTPNPWSEKTVISFYISHEQSVKFNVYDITGKVIWSIDKVAESGTNNIFFHKDDFQATGVIYYELVTESQRVTKKMLLLQ